MPLHSHADAIRALYTRRAWFYHLLFFVVLGVGRQVARLLREYEVVQPRFKILDAGCGTGNATRALYRLARERGVPGVVFHAFDLTPSMMEIFRRWVERTGARNIALRQCDVLQVGSLPPDWCSYDRIVSVAMVEHLPRDQVYHALRNLRRLLAPGGKLLIIVTNRTVVPRLFIRRWWASELYNEGELRQLFLDAGLRVSRMRRLMGDCMVAIEGMSYEPSSTINVPPPRCISS